MIKDQGDQKPFIKKPWSMIKGPKKSMVPLIKVRWTLIFWEHHLDQGQVDVKPLNFLTFLYVQEHSFLLPLQPEDWNQFYYRVWLEVARLCSIFRFIYPCLPDQVSRKDDSWTINLLRHDVFLSRRCESSSWSLLLEYVNVSDLHFYQVQIQCKHMIHLKSLPLRESQTVTAVDGKVYMCFRHSMNNISKGCCVLDVFQIGWQTLQLNR